MQTRAISSWVAFALAGAIACGGTDPDAPATPAPGAPPVDNTSGNGVVTEDGSKKPNEQPPGSDPSTKPPPGAGANYDSDGTVPFASEVKKVTTPNRSFDVTMYLPTTPGPHPLVSISSGNMQKGEGYTIYAKRLASHGIATLLRDDPGTWTASADIAADLVATIGTWVPSMLAGKVDTKRIGLAGHSRGGGVSLIAAEGGLKGKVVAWFGLDPVDNQFLVNPGAYGRTNIATIGIPTAYLGSEIASNCAPAADSHSMLWPKTSKPSVLIVGLGAGHTQFTPPNSCSACGVCSPAGTADANVVLGYAVRYLTAFFARELLGDTGVGPAFEGAGGPADVAAKRVTIASK